MTSEPATEKRRREAAAPSPTIRYRAIARTKVALVIGAASVLPSPRRSLKRERGSGAPASSKLKALLRRRHGLRAAFKCLDVRDEAHWRGRRRDPGRGWSPRYRRQQRWNHRHRCGPDPADPEHPSLEVWRSVQRTNLDGVLLGCKHAIRAMRRHGKGSIINIASRAGQVGIPAAAAYAQSKAAVRNNTKTVALYCTEQGLDTRAMRWFWPQFGRRYGNRCWEMTRIGSELWMASSPTHRSGVSASHAKWRPW